MDERQKTEPTRRRRAPGRATLALERAEEAHARLDTQSDDEESVVEVAEIRARFWETLIDAVVEFAASANFRWLLLAVVVTLLGPLVILGTWLIDGGIAADGWGCYGTAAFCSAAEATPPEAP